MLTPNSRRIIEQDTVQLDRAGRAGGRRRQSRSRGQPATSVVWTLPWPASREVGAVARRTDSAIQTKNVGIGREFGEG